LPRSWIDPFILLKTHPDIAALVGPLFACGGKRAKDVFLIFNIELLNSLFPPKAKRGWSNKVMTG
jgi:hypothetical protein